MRRLLILLILAGCYEPDAIDGELYVVLGKRKPVTHVDSLIFRAYKYGHQEGWSEGYSSRVCIH